MPSLAVCIATYERPELLGRTLAALATQTRPADEVVVVDASPSFHADALLAELRRLHPKARILATQTGTRALPELRWLAFEHTTADLVLFLDDDVQLAPGALAALEAAYSAPAAPHERPAAVGFSKWFDDGGWPIRDRDSWRERWLGTAAYESGRMTDGGLTVSHAGLPAMGTTAVEHLWGGAMSYRRDVLLRIGRLDRLIGLYRRGLGRGEDVVLSRCAASFGPLLLLLDPLALHPRDLASARTPYARAGWRLGLTATWGRAHTLRWVARRQTALRRDWLRLAGLELARSAKGIALHPWAAGGWQRLAGALAGIVGAAASWHRIPAEPRAGAASHASLQATAAVQPLEVHR